MKKQRPRQSYRLFMERTFKAALKAVDPYAALMSHFSVKGSKLKAGSKTYDLDKFERVVVIGAGKAGYPMARACEKLLGKRIHKGLLIVKDGHGGKLKRIELVEGTHPLPSERNFKACQRLLELAHSCGPKDLVLLLISGGGSALLPAPVQSVSLKDKLEATKVLLGCGATITELNCIRKHLSQIKGGGLARALAPATTIVPILSDVIGDHLDAIASGPVTADPTTFKEAWAVVRRYDVEGKLPKSVVNHLAQGRDGQRPETLKPGDKAFDKVQPLLVGTNRKALEAVKKSAKDKGYQVMVLSSTLEGEARELAKFYCAIARENYKVNRKKPLLILGGGETTVTIRGKGKGGRNQEFALACVEQISGMAGVFAAGFATDGTDGPTDAAGAFADWQTAQRAIELGMDTEDYLARNDAYNYFTKLEQLINTGPTGTNVCDLYVVGLL